MPTDPLVPTAERTLRLIELLLDHPDGLTPQEMLPQLELSRSSLFLLLGTLKSLGYAEQAEKRGRYRAGPRLELWRSAASPTSKDLLSAFYQEAAHQSGPETLALVTPSESGPLLLAQVEGTQQVRSVLTPGQPAPGLDAAAVALQAEPPEEVRTNGYAFGELDDTFDLALPICRDGSRPDATLLLSAPRFSLGARGAAESFPARLACAGGAAVVSPGCACLCSLSHAARFAPAAHLAAGSRADRSFLARTLGGAASLRAPGWQPARHPGLAGMGRRELHRDRLAGLAVG